MTNVSSFLSSNVLSWLVHDVSDAITDYIHISSDDISLHTAGVGEVYVCVCTCRCIHVYARLSHTESGCGLVERRPLTDTQPPGERSALNLCRPLIGRALLTAIVSREHDESRQLWRHRHGYKH